MVEDSIVNKFSAGSVSVAGVGLWDNADDSLIKANVVDKTGITFTMAKNGGAVGNSYSINNSGYNVGIVVVDKDGVVQFAQQENLRSGDEMPADKLVSDASAAVRSLLATGCAGSGATPVYAHHVRNSPARYFTLSGQMIVNPKGSASAGLVVRSVGGRVFVSQCRVKLSR